MTDKAPWDTEAMERHQECQERLHGAGEMAQPVGRLPCNQEDLVLVPRTHEENAHSRWCISKISGLRECRQAGPRDSLASQPSQIIKFQVTVRHLVSKKNKVDGVFRNNT